MELRCLVVRMRLRSRSTRICRATCSDYQCAIMFVPKLGGPPCAIATHSANYLAATVTYSSHTRVIRRPRVKRDVGNHDAAASLSATATRREASGNGRGTSEELNRLAYLPCGQFYADMARHKPLPLSSAINSPDRVEPNVEHRFASVSGSGAQPLTTELHQRLEPAFRADFGSVLVHDDSVAARAVQLYGALAWTHGEDIAFAASRYAPHTTSGFRLLSHEVAHGIREIRAEPSAPTQFPIHH